MRETGRKYKTRTVTVIKKKVMTKNVIETAMFINRNYEYVTVIIM